jgi:hypothetical protein
LTKASAPNSPRARLARVPSPDRAEAFGAALAHADPDAANDLALDLLDALAQFQDAPLWHRAAHALPPRLVPEGLRRNLDQRWGKPARRRAALRLAARWHDLDRHTQRLAAVSLHPIWGDLLADHASNPESRSGAKTGKPLNPAQLVGVAAAAAEAGDPASALAHATLLRADDPRVVLAAAAGLGRAALSAIDPALRAELPKSLTDELTAAAGPAAPACLGDPAARSLLTEAVVAGVRSASDHRRREVLLAALILAADETLGTGSTKLIRMLLADATAPGARELASALRRCPAPVLRACAWRWLDGTVAEGPLIDRLGQAHTDGDHAAWLDLAHLALRPVRAQRARQLCADPRTARACLPQARALTSLQPGARLGFVRTIDLLARTDAARREHLTPLLADPEPRVRLAAAAASPAEDLPDWCFDADPAVARSATLRWAGVGTAMRRPDTPAAAARSRTLTALTRSPHGPVRVIAGEALAAMSPWKRVDATSAMLFRRWQAADADAALNALTARMTGGSAAERVQAIALATRCELTADFAEVLVASARLTAASMAGGERVAATAVKALARVRTASAERAIDAAAAHADPRVRANAVEALAMRPRAARGVDRDTVLIEFKGDDAHRARANAIRAMLLGDAGGIGNGGGGGGAWTAGVGEIKPRRVYEPAAVEELERLLTDDRAEHRLAGVWLAERTLCAGGADRLGPAFDGLTRRVARLAKDDADERVRRRGVRCASRLLTELRGDDTERRAVVETVARPARTIRWDDMKTPANEPMSEATSEKVVPA